MSLLWMHKTTHEGWDPIETYNSGAKVAVLKAKNDRWGLGPKETCISDPKVAVLHAKATNEC